MRILWWSNAPWVATGYGQQTALFARRIKERLGHEVGLFAFYGLRGSAMQWNDLQCYPGAHDRWGNDVANAHAKHFQADVIVSLGDLSMIKPQAIVDVPWCPWFPVDCEPMRPSETGVLRRALQPLVFSRHAERQVLAAGFLPRYVPHGVDCTVFQPRDKAAAREAIGLPQDRYIVGMVAANKGNPSRKAFAEHIQAFARFHKRHPESLLYLHTHRTPEMEGLSLDSVCQLAGLEVGQDKAVVFVPQYQNAAGLVDPLAMANVYSSLDVLASVSYGEGFGVPILEAQACGVPVIVGDWTAMPEICFAGQMVSKDDAERVWSKFNTWQWAPHISAIEAALEAAYQRGVTDSDRVLMAEGAARFDADLVTDEYWRPALAEIESWVCADAGKLQMVSF